MPTVHPVPVHPADAARPDPPLGALDDRLQISQAEGLLCGLTGCTRAQAAQALRDTGAPLELDAAQTSRLFLRGVGTEGHEQSEHGVVHAVLDVLAVTARDWGSVPEDERHTGLRVMPTPGGAGDGLAVSGELDLDTAPMLTVAAAGEVAYRCRFPSGSALFILDLTGVSFLDVAGVRALEEVQRQIDDARLELRVVTPPARGPRRLLLLAVAQRWLGAAFTVDEGR
jgi:ABC-type transporter Mla MlaB component